MTRSRRALGALATTLVGFALCVQPLAAQGRVRGPEGQLLREAATLESRGDLDGAERALRRLIETDPTSSGAIFAMERVLRAKGDVSEVLPLLDAFLAREAHPGLRGLKLELLVEADFLGAVVDEADAWISEAPTKLVYREVARVYERAFGPERALAVLRGGRSALGDDAALALEIGDLLASMGDSDGAADEWALSVGDDGSGRQAVTDRLLALRDGDSGSARRLVSVLVESGVPARFRAAWRLAIDTRLQPEALDLTQRYAADLVGPARTRFLAQAGMLARENDLAPVASWVYAEMSGEAASPDERRQHDERIVEMALEVGDTATALDAQRRVVASFSQSSEEWRRASAMAIQMEATAAPDRLPESWAAFRDEFPDAPELDRVAAATAASLQARGDLEGAAAVLEGIDGPMSTLERAYLLLDEGDMEGGRGMLRLAVGGLSPSDATAVIQFLSLLDRLTEPGVRALVAAGVAAHRGRGAEAAPVLAREATELPPADGAPVLAEAARMADRNGAPDTAVEIRQRLVRDHPDAPEVGEASLALARYHAGPGGDPLEAVRLLEDLITSRPNAAIVPEARLELERLRSRGS